MDPDYEMVDKPDHSAYNGQGDHKWKYKEDEVEEPQPQAEKTLLQRISSWFK